MFGPLIVLTSSISSYVRYIIIILDLGIILKLHKGFSAVDQFL